VLKQHRSTQRHAPRGKEDEERLVSDMIALTRASMVVTAIAGSLPCCAMQAGM